MASFSPAAVALDLWRSRPQSGLPATAPAPLDASLSQHVTEVRVHIDSDRAIVEARRHGRQLSARAGFALVDRALIAATISELARNILLYAAKGDIVVRLLVEDSRSGLLIVASDQGPGLASISDALRDGYSTSGRLGAGLPGVKRLADEFEIKSVVGQGTAILIRKWRR
jgi:serine/threonine-protein kinase RsbT